MKLKIAYDLPDKIREAETGFSLNKTAKKVGTLTTVSTAICYGINLAAGAPPIHYVTDPFAIAAIHCGYRAIEQAMLGRFYKAQAQDDIIRLLSKLENINVYTNYYDLMQATTYKTEYETDLKNGVVEQKKYINVPVNDCWGEREMSICQEHIIGSKEWNLSLGTPQKEKVYTLGMKKMINR